MIRAATSVPKVDGHLTHYVGEPNGSFADWNTRVTCDSQPAPPPIS